MTGRGLAFDLEGTLIDLEKAHHLGHLKVAAELGLDWSLKEAMHRIDSFVGGPDSAIAVELARLSGTRLSQREIEARMREQYLDLRRSMQTRPRPGAVGLLKAARSLGLPLSIGSVTTLVDGTELLARSKLSPYFPPDTRVFLEDVHRPKPHPDVYLATAVKMGVSAGNQIVFEDSVSGVRSAVAAGSLVIAVPAQGAKHLRSALFAAGAREVLSSWRAVGPPREYLSELLAISR